MIRTVKGKLASAVKHPLLREFLAFGTSTVLEQASRVITSLIVAGMVGPMVWGAWYVLNLVLRYGSLAHLGSLNGLNRQYALEMGRGNKQEAEALLRASFGALLVSVIAASLLSILVFLAVGRTDYLMPTVLTLILLVFQQMYNFTTVAFRARIQFRSVSAFQTVIALVNPAVSLPLTYFFGLNGFIVGQAIGYLVVVAYAFQREPSLYRFEFDLPRAKRLVGIGFPIMLVGVLYALFNTVDRWIILEHFGTVELGYYSIAIMALGAAALLPQIVAQQFYPRMSRQWGANRNLAELKRMARIQGLLGLAPTVLVVIAAQLVGPPLIRGLLPEFTPGISSFRIVMLAPIVNCFGQGYANLLNVTDRQYRYLGVLIWAIIGNAALSYILALPFGLQGVAWGTVIGFAMFSVGLLVVGSRERQKGSPA